MKQRLYRSRQGKMIGGVCTGLGEYFNLDPVLIRLLFVVFLILNGVGLLAYIILWIVVPWQPDYVEATSTPIESIPSTSSESGIHTESTRAERKPDGKTSAATGYILIGIGVLFLFNNFLPGFSFGDYWPLLLIAVGGGILWNSSPRPTATEVEL